ncbi:unnamed protein product [Gongylonema pulchrum]|uniref:Lipoprotein n=1 Tax=Gongylonema pulchrum TaxID=637853 RepID=A0A183E6G7_9BILA|nr:unnamed protein product [Gongylonema pulchrum]
MTGKGIIKEAKKDRVDCITSTQGIGRSGASGVGCNRSEWNAMTKMINAAESKTDRSVGDEDAGIKGANSCQKSSGTCKRYSSSDDLPLAASAAPGK